MALEYTKKVMDHFTNPRNVGELENPQGHAVEGSPACGDMISIDLEVKDKTITDIKFKSYGCASNIATASVVTEIAKGKTIDEARNINWKDVEAELEGLPQVKVHCSVLAVNTLKKAIEDYEKKQGIKTKKITVEEKVHEELNNVINPNTGKTLIDDRLVKDISIKGKKIIVKLSLTEDNLYKNNITEEIYEHLRDIFDEIKVVFGA